MNVLSIDVEEIFHAEYVRHARKSGFTYRVPYNIPLVLDLLEECGVKATFFVVGEVAEKFPEVIAMIVNEGHEVAFHSYDHRPLWEKNPMLLEAEVDRFNELLKSMTGNVCLGFRAPSFSLDNETKWALEVLEKKGMLYDSSVFPAWTPLYGVSGAPTRPYKPSKDDVTVEDVDGKVWEFPLTVYSLLNLRFPAAGGFYLRFMPKLVWKAIKKMNKRRLPAVIFIHCWELDAEVPKLRLNPYKSFVTYHNIKRGAKLLRDLLADFDFTSFAEYIKAAGII